LLPLLLPLLALALAGIICLCRLLLLLLLLLRWLLHKQIKRTESSSTTASVINSGAVIGCSWLR
jgi:hypothetical protein